jgi:AAA domain
MTNVEIDKEYSDLREALIKELSGSCKLAVVQAPPGSGKTYMLLAVVSSLVREGKRVSLAAQTRRQADDIAHRWERDYGQLPAVRLGSSGSQAPDDFPDSVPWITELAALPHGPGLYISTTAKWTWARDLEPFDVLAIDEAWQMAWGDLMQCAKLSKKFFMIGDPGQIPPVVSVDVRRWATAPRPPHKPAPEVVLDDTELRATAFIGSLPACRRLPHESVKYVKPFYNFDFSAYAEPSERLLNLSNDEADQQLVGIINMLNSGQPVLVTLPTPEEGLPPEVDIELTLRVEKIVRTLLTGRSQIVVAPGDKPRTITVKDIGICATHRAMNGELRKALGADFSDVSIDTPERWQGLERPIMIVVHPLSNVTDPSDFDLETGRLCVMASRHQVGLVVITRDHVGASLEAFIPEASQAPGQPDVVGRGHFAHARFWNDLVEDQRLVALT